MKCFSFYKTAVTSLFFTHLPRVLLAARPQFDGAIGRPCAWPRGPVGAVRGQLFSGIMQCNVLGPASGFIGPSTPHAPPPPPQAVHRMCCQFQCSARDGRGRGRGEGQQTMDVVQLAEAVRGERGGRPRGPESVSQCRSDRLWGQRSVGADWSRRVGGRGGGTDGGTRQEPRCRSVCCICHPVTLELNVATGFLICFLIWDVLSDSNFYLILLHCHFFVSLRGACVVTNVIHEIELCYNLAGTYRFKRAFRVHGRFSV